jgi:TonB family protein
MNQPQSAVRELKESSSSARLAVLMMAAAMVACSLTPRWTKKNEPRVLRCFAQSTGATATTNSPTANSTDGQSESRQQSENLVTSEDGGFTIKLPSAFPPPDPPEPIKQGYEYAGISYYSTLGGCRCRINYTDLTGMALSGKSDEEVLADRRELVSKELVNDKYQPVIIYKSEASRIQNHHELTLYASGTGVNGQPEYRRHKFIVARGRVYTVEFSSEDKTELDHPEVDAFFNSFHFVGELDGRVISKPEPEYPAIAKSTRTQGTVVVEVTVNTDGSVVDARVVTGPRLLHSAAKAAALKARFAPGNAETKGTLTYNFTAR